MLGVAPHADIKVVVVVVEVVVVVVVVVQRLAEQLGVDLAGVGEEVDELLDARVPVQRSRGVELRAVARRHQHHLRGGEPLLRGLPHRLVRRSQHAHGDVGQGGEADCRVEPGLFVDGEDDRAIAVADRLQPARVEPRQQFQRHQRERLTPARAEPTLFAKRDEGHGRDRDRQQRPSHASSSRSALRL